MGPTNVALVKLFQADLKLRDAQNRLEAVTRGVRLQERKLKDLTEKLQAGQSALRELQSQAGQLDLDIKIRDERIEKLRQQQTTTSNNREYQAFLVEINTEKVDKNKVEEQALKVMEQVEKKQAEVKDLQAQVETEQKKLAGMREQIGSQKAAVQAEIDQLKPARDEAAAGVPAKARDAFERLADRYDGEGMSAIAKPDRRREEYMCSVCNMDLVVDIYNRLHVRDEPVFCPSCRRILYIPDDLPPEMAIHTKKKKEEKPDEQTAESA